MACVRGSVSLLVAHFEFVEGLERSFAFSAALLSDWQSPDFIDFSLQCSLSKYPTADLKDLRHCDTSAATHSSSYNGRLQRFVFEGGGRDDRLCEREMIGEHNLNPHQLSLPLPLSLSLALLFFSLYLTLSFHSDTEKILYTDWLPLNPRCDSSPNFKLPSS